MGSKGGMKPGGVMPNLESPHIRGFPKIRVPYLGVFYNKDPTIEGIILGSPVFENPQYKRSLILPTFIPPFQG